jgi:hypothetical protein
MAFKHPLDPQTQWDAATTAGKLVAQGVIAKADVLPQLFDAAIRAGYTGDRRGLRSRLTWHLTEVTSYWRGVREKTERMMRQELITLLASFADGTDILDTAHKINEGANEPLLRFEVKRVVEEEIAKLLAAMQPPTQKKRGRRYAR